MIYEKNLKDELNDLSSLKDLTQIFGEIASLRMKKIRSFVFTNRDFLQSIRNIFEEVLSSYLRKMSELVKRGKVKKDQKITFLSHNGKIVSVFLSANTGFYGEVIKDTFKAFLEDVKAGRTEAAIIGKLGLSLFLQKEPQRPYTYFYFPDYGIDQEKLTEIIKHLVAYEEIRIFYGEYKTIISQKPNKVIISAGTQLTDATSIPRQEYIFEPSMEKILMFFETEIFASTFDQSLRESQLAKFASRVIAMDEAGVKIGERIKNVDLRRLRLSHNILNKKQENLVSYLAV